MIQCVTQRYFCFFKCVRNAFEQYIAQHFLAPPIRKYVIGTEQIIYIDDKANGIAKTG